MTERERLIKLITKAESEFDDLTNPVICCEKYVADYLLANGWRFVKTARNLTNGHPVDEFICSECGAMFADVSLVKVDEDDGDINYYEFEFKYCPKCGSEIEDFWKDTSVEEGEQE